MPARVPIVHDFTERQPERDYSFNPIGRHGRAFVIGWGASGIRLGDILVLDETKYTVLEIQYRRDPPDMWQARVQRVGTGKVREGFSLRLSTRQRDLLKYYAVQYGRAMKRPLYESDVIRILLEGAPPVPPPDNQLDVKAAMMEMQEDFSDLLLMKGNSDESNNQQ